MPVGVRGLARRCSQAVVHVAVGLKLRTSNTHNHLWTLLERLVEPGTVYFRLQPVLALLSFSKLTPLPSKSYPHKGH